MKRFIKILIIFTIGLFGLAFVIDHIISTKLQKLTTSLMFAGWNDIYSGKINSDIIIMGNSRAWAQYNPLILDSILNVNSYNLGIDGSPINRQIIKYNTYQRFNIKPKYIIQNIDMITIAIHGGYQREQFFPYFFDDSLKTAISHYEHFNVLEKYIPCFRYIGYNVVKQSLGIGNTQKENIIKGYKGNDTNEWDGKKHNEQKEIHYGQDSMALSLFDKYLSKAHAENIKVIFVYAPIYIGATQKVKNIEGMYAMYDSIAKKYDIPILDYNYDPISYDTAYFYNATHLNKTGSELFTTKLAHDIDSLGIMK
ncbi:MAG: hypothetical protein LBN18_05915 [Dysgonamonadaceae bacterium]|jgi:hypothetical protein|nr:hypothetical protein [Dysgonamonadaceae bacterium]